VDKTDAVTFVPNADLIHDWSMSTNRGNGRNDAPFKDPDSYGANSEADELIDRLTKNNQTNRAQVDQDEQRRDNDRHAPIQADEPPGPGAVPGSGRPEDGTDVRSGLEPDLPPDSDVPKRPESRDGRDGNAGDGDFEPGRQARRYAEEAIAAYDEVRGDLRRLREDLVGLREEIDSLTASVDTQIVGVRETLGAGSGQSPGQALQLTAGQTALVDDVDDAEASAPGAGRSLWDRIRHWLGRAGRKLWAMIAHLVRVKE
jgi:hypothetical protein